MLPGLWLKGFPSIAVLLLHVFKLKVPVSEQLKLSGELLGCESAQEVLPGLKVSMPSIYVNVLKAVCSQRVRHTGHSPASQLPLQLILSLGAEIC